MTRVLSGAFLWGAAGFLLAMIDLPQGVTAGLGVMLAGVVLGWWRGRPGRRWHGGLIMIGLLLLGMILGMTRLKAHQQYLDKLAAAFPVGEGITREATVVKAADGLASGRVRFQARLSEGASFLVYSDADPNLLPGDRIILRGRWGRPEPIDDFDWPAYLRGQKITGVVYQAAILKKKTARGGPARWLARARSELAGHIKTALPEPQAGILAAMLLGERTGITDETRRQFARAGISHILAISGLHMAVVGGGLLLLFRWLRLPRRIIFPGVGGLLFVYAFFTGFRISIFRSAVMGGIGLWALVRETNFNPLRLLLLTATGFLIWNPLLLKTSAAFQLSFLAVAGILIFWPLLNHYLRSAIPWPAVRALVTVTLAAQLATLPVTAARFGVLSLISPLVNLLVVPLLPLIILAGALFLAAAVLVPPIAFYASWPVLLPLNLILLISAAAAKLPGFYAEGQFGREVWLSTGAVLVFGAFLSFWLTARHLTPYALWRKALKR